jgi:hypothetical protein
MDGTPSFGVEYLESRTRWNYPRRGNPVRNVEFVGITTFAPRVEKKDRVHHARGKLQVLGSRTVDQRIVQSVSRILGTNYTELKQHKVGIQGKWEDLIPQLSRGGASYSEPHMGAGEQKVVRLVETIERVPNKSLILLEEPELTLHPDAQVGLAWYLMAAARRNGHQILIATHSEHLFQALPRQARILMVRTSAGLEVLHDVSNLRAARELTNTMRTNGPLILVEDDAAAAFLREIFRQVDPAMHNNCAIVGVGNDDDVQHLTSNLRGAGLRVVGVRDGDRAEAPGELLFSLPGGDAPETVLVSNDNLQSAEATLLAGVLKAFERAMPIGQGHPATERDKRVLQQIARELNMAPPDLASRLTQIWLLKHRDAATALVEKVRGALDSA